MIKRIVKMKFKPEDLDEFMVLFNDTKDKIRHFEGCKHLELWQDQRDPCQLFTYSFWASIEALEEYRGSELFKRTWAKTKVLFSDKPQAWSIQVISEV